MNRGLFGVLGAILVLGSSGVLSGCGGSGRPETIPVSGTVTLDGKPVAGASVMFSPEPSGRPATGVTDEQGRFTLKTFEAGDGALVGKHTVTVALVKTTGFMADKDGLSGGIAPEGIREEWIVPKKFADPKTSGLSVEVASGMDDVKLDLTSN